MNVACFGLMMFINSRKGLTVVFVVNDFDDLLKTIFFELSMSLPIFWSVEETAALDADPDSHAARRVLEGGVVHPVQILLCVGLEGVAAAVPLVCVIHLVVRLYVANEHVRLFKTDFVTISHHAHNFVFQIALRMNVKMKQRLRKN